MKNYSKVGNRGGRTAYRTPSVFRYQKSVEAARLKAEARRRYFGK